MSSSFWKKRAPTRSKPTPIPQQAPAPPVAPLPAPVGNMQPIPVTNESDGIVINRGYSYFSACWLAPDGTILTFCGIVGKRPQFFRVELNDTITRRGPLLNYDGEAEGWYFDHGGNVYVCDGPRLKRVNLSTGQYTVALDISETRPGHDLWQAHSSDDGRSHSATLRQIASEGPYPKIGTVVQCGSGRMFYAATGTLDESHITADGSYVIIKETDEQGRLYNRIVSCADGGDGYRLNPGEAIGHSDCGSDFIVGEDSQIGACIRFDPRTRERRPLFDSWAVGHLSVRGRRCLHTNDTTIRMIDVETKAITPVCDHGMIGSGYDFQCHANLSPCGRAAAWVSNVAGRMDLYACRLT